MIPPPATMMDPQRPLSSSGRLEAAASRGAGSSPLTVEAKDFTPCDPEGGGRKSTPSILTTGRTLKVQGEVTTVVVAAAAADFVKPLADGKELVLPIPPEEVEEPPSESLPPDEDRPPPTTTTTTTSHAATTSSGHDGVSQAATTTPATHEGKAQGRADESTEAHAKRMWAGQSNILVAVRVRPLLKHDRIQKGIVSVLDRKVVVILDPNKVNEEKDVLRAKRSREKQYAFDYVFEESDGQPIVYQCTTRFLIQGVLDGFNATVFAYGNTGAGKTYTMIGTEPSPGIMVLTLQDLFRLSAVASESQGLTYKVTVSFLEVYNENIRDLLSDVEEYLDLREDPIKGPVVAGITEVQAQSAEEVMGLLHRGNRNRTQHPTAANEVSSRSHAVLQVVVESKDRAPGTVDNYKIGKLSLVDLAGSERAAVTSNRGVRLQEGANINRSLLALGNCINALGEKGNKGHFVPYRDSKLTRLLKDSLGGNCRTVMIANISSAISSFEETLNTLKYANRAKNIKTTLHRNVLSVNHHISEYVSLISGLRGEIANLKQQLAEQGGAKPPLNKLDGMEEARNQIVENFRERMQLRRSLIELEDQNVQNSIEVGKRQLFIFEWNELRDKSKPPPGQEQGEGEEAEVEIQGEDGTITSHRRLESLDSQIDLVENGRHERTFSSDVVKDAPADVKVAWAECEQLRTAIEKNHAVKRNISRRLRHNEKQADRLREKLNSLVSGEERRDLMELQYRIGRLELENMELEQSRIVHESIMKGKDLTIQKLSLQLAVKDKVIAQQRKILEQHNLDSLVSYNSLVLIEQAALSSSQSMETLAPAGENTVAPIPDTATTTTSHPPPCTATAKDSEGPESGEAPDVSTTQPGPHAVNDNFASITQSESFMVTHNDGFAPATQSENFANPLTSRRILNTPPHGRGRRNGFYAAFRDTSKLSKYERIQSIYSDDSWWHQGDRRRRSRGERGKDHYTNDDAAVRNKRKLRRNGTLKMSSGAAPEPVGSLNSNQVNICLAPAGQVQTQSQSHQQSHPGGKHLKWKNQRKLAQISPLPCIDKAQPGQAAAPPPGPRSPTSPTPRSDDDLSGCPEGRNRTVISNYSDLSQDSVLSVSSPSPDSMSKPEQPAIKVALGHLRSKMQHASGGSHQHNRHGVLARPERRRTLRVLHEAKSRSLGCADDLIAGPHIPLSKHVRCEIQLPQELTSRSSPPHN